VAEAVVRSELDGFVLVRPLLDAVEEMATSLTLDKPVDAYVLTDAMEKEMMKKRRAAKKTAGNGKIAADNFYNLGSVDLTEDTPSVAPPTTVTRNGSQTSLAPTRTTSSVSNALQPSIEWDCPLCTYINVPGCKICEMCGTAVPTAYLVDNTDNAADKDNKPAKKLTEEEEYEAMLNAVLLESSNMAQDALKHDLGPFPSMRVDVNPDENVTEASAQPAQAQHSQDAPAEAIGSAAMDTAAIGTAVTASTTIAPSVSTVLANITGASDTTAVVPLVSAAEEPLPSTLPVENDISRFDLSGLNDIPDLEDPGRYLFNAVDSPLGVLSFESGNMHQKDEKAEKSSILSDDRTDSSDSSWNGSTTSTTTTTSSSSSSNDSRDFVSTLMPTKVTTADSATPSRYLTRSHTRGATPVPLESMAPVAPSKTVSEPVALTYARLVDNASHAISLTDQTGMPLSFRVYHYNGKLHSFASAESSQGRYLVVQTADEASGNSMLRNGTLSRSASQVAAMQDVTCLSVVLGDYSGRFVENDLADVVETTDRDIIIVEMHTTNASIN